MATLAIDHSQSLQVNFQNRAIGGTDGWWDFEMAPASNRSRRPSRRLCRTFYTKPGTYTAKLTVHNLIGDESERTVNVQLDGTATPGANTATEVAALDVGSTRPDKVRSRQRFTCPRRQQRRRLHMGCRRIEDRTTVRCPPLSRYVTFKEPGKHIIRLAAMRGKQMVEKNVVVEVDPPQVGAAAPLMAVVNVTYLAEQVDTQNIARNVAIDLPAEFKTAEVPFQKEILPLGDFKIVAAKQVQQVQHPGVKDVNLAITPDGKGGADVHAGKVVPDAGPSSSSSGC